ncbi:DUF2987 domain-containing protein [Plesiomonas sp.]|uniref:DUF2987 domain-containing protein n=1 Tax=Plesiomonas sp. TaxID=2486279 RepID=UPI003F669C5A
MYAATILNAHDKIKSKKTTIKGNALFNAVHKVFYCGSLVFLGLSAGYADAASQVFEYKTFYDDVSRVNSADETKLAARLAYFLRDPQTKQDCKIARITMSSGRNNEQISVDETDEIRVPQDSNLRSINPNITIETANATPCDISIQVLATLPMTTTISGQQLQTLVADMNTLYQRLGTFFTRSRMPKVAGVIVHFPTETGQISVANAENSVTTVETRTIEYKQHEWAVDFTQFPITKSDVLTFSVKPTKITPFIQQD